jgi:hypothetical protein
MVVVGFVWCDVRLKNEDVIELSLLYGVNTSTIGLYVRMNLNFEKAPPQRMVDNDDNLRNPYRVYVAISARKASTMSAAALDFTHPIARNRTGFTSALANQTASPRSIRDKGFVRGCEDRLSKW